jgi:hypothetical protein
VARLRFVVGRVEHRLFRAPGVAGWTADETDAAPARGTWPLQKVPGGGALLVAPAAPGVVLSPAAVQALEGSAVSALIAWPEAVVVIRHGGIVVHGEGDVVHFGDLALDPQRVLRRIGFDYLHATGGDVTAQMQLEERSAVDPARALRRSGFDSAAERLGPAPAPAPAPAPPPAPRESAVLDTIRMAAGQSARFGPYELALERAWDHARRPLAGDSGHGYFYRLRRVGEEVVQSRASGYPDPLDLDRPEPLVGAARGHLLLDEDEALAGEPDRLADLLQRYEGPRARLEDELRRIGPWPPRLRRSGDAVVAEAARLARAPDGAPVVGRAAVWMGPTGAAIVRREDVTSLPGRLRRRR